MAREIQCFSCDKVVTATENNAPLLRGTATCPECESALCDAAHELVKEMTAAAEILDKQTAEKVVSWANTVREMMGI